MGKTKILFLAANPIKTSQLWLDEEIRAITEKIRAAEYRDLLHLVSAWAVRPDDLLQLLNEHKPQIVHFSGHGSPTGEIILVDNGRREKPVSTMALEALFTVLKDNIQVVLLNACYSHLQAEAIAEVIDCVIGMNDAIGDEAAITFAASFYRAIGFGRSVQEAFDQGKTALLLEGISEDNIPEIMTRANVDPALVFPVKPSASNKEFSTVESVLLTSFSINSQKCDYKEYVFDPSKLFWPEEDGGAVRYQGGKLVEIYGKTFSEEKEAREYGQLLRRTRNHRSFSKDSVHQIYFERLDNSNQEGPNYPDFYISVSNKTKSHIVLNAIEAIVVGVSPLAAIGKSHTLKPLASYKIRVPPYAGNTRTPMIPNLKIEAGDAAAFELLVIPEVSRVGSCSWLMKLRFYYAGGDCIETPYFIIIM
jgi:CHAT domain